MAKVARKKSPRSRPHPEAHAGPWRPPLTMLAPLRTPRALQFTREDLDPPSRAPVQPRLRAGPEPPGGRRRENAGGRAPEPDWRGRDALGGARSLACPRGGGKTRPDSPARRQPRPPDVGGGDGGGQLPLTASQPEPRPGPATPSAAPLWARAFAPGLVLSPERGRRPQITPRPARSSSYFARPSPFPELTSFRRGAFRLSPPLIFLSS